MPEQRKEIGLRVLVGATGLALLRDRARRELVPVIAGTVLGAGVALATTSLIASSAPDDREVGVLTFGALAGGMFMWLVRQAIFATLLPFYLRKILS